MCRVLCSSCVIRFKVLTVVLLKSEVFWDVILGALLWEATVWVSVYQLT